MPYSLTSSQFVVHSYGDLIDLMDSFQVCNSESLLIYLGQVPIWSKFAIFSRELVITPI